MQKAASTEVLSVDVKSKRNRKFHTLAQASFLDFTNPGRYERPGTILLTKDDDFYWLSYVS